jgi:hypothetical protein
MTLVVVGSMKGKIMVTGRGTESSDSTSPFKVTFFETQFRIIAIGVVAFAVILN